MCIKQPASALKN